MRKWEENLKLSKKLIWSIVLAMFISVNVGCTTDNKGSVTKVSTTKVTEQSESSAKDTKDTKDANNTKEDNSSSEQNKTTLENTKDSTVQNNVTYDTAGVNNIISSIKANSLQFTSKPYQEINSNIPTFTKDDLTTSSWEKYSDLDKLGRVGVANANIGQDLMPTEKRGEIGMIKPSGWHTVKYDIVDGKYLYNRCHLIGYQLSGENANNKNLMTGTRYLNVDGMLPFEDKVAEYVKLTKNHVRYRVTPIFVDNELVARGVQMEAQSIEDNGAGIKFNVYVFNAEPGIKINFATGDSSLDSSSVSNTNTSSSTNTNSTPKVTSNNSNSSSSTQVENKNTQSSATSTGGAVYVDSNGKGLIKGNINSKKEKIYHMPGGQYYEKTVAEQYFKTEQEAIDAGFRKSLR